MTLEEVLRAQSPAQVMARTGWGEARGDAASQSPVLWALMNRFKASKGKTMHDIALAPKQFSTWNESDPNRDRAANVGIDDPIFNQLLVHAQRILAGQEQDPTGGAEFYFTGKRPNWDFNKLEPAGTFGAHQFFRRKADKAKVSPPAGE